MQAAIEKLIGWMPRGGKVLDIGCAGLDGENTSEFLINHFTKEGFVGVCRKTQWNKESIANFESKHVGVTVLDRDFYEMEFDGQFDLLVLDLNIDNNILKDWTEEGMERAKSIVKRGGYLINYVMTTTEYGDTDTPALLAKHRDKWWGSFSDEDITRKLNNINDWEYVAHQKEERRPEIIWVLLKKK